jgi:hypothetical protein
MAEDDKQRRLEMFDGILDAIKREAIGDDWGSGDRRFESSRPERRSPQRAKRCGLFMTALSREISG